MKVNFFIRSVQPCACVWGEKRAEEGKEARIVSPYMCRR